MKFYCCLSVALVLLLSGVSPDSTSRSLAGQESVQPLVEAKWLADHLDDEDLRIIDLAHRIKDYNKGHIPNAVFVNWKSDIINPDKADRYTLPETEAWEKLLSNQGIKPDTHIVLSDNFDNRSSVRMYWTAKYFGHEKISVLNGGTDAWRSAGYALTKLAPETNKTNYKVSKTNDAILTSIQAVRDAISKTSAHMLDGRPANQYSGEAPGKVFNTGKEHKRRGHATTAINIPWAANLDESGKFIPTEQLRSLYRKHGIESGDKVLTYCNEGLHAAMPWFVLHELLGEKDITLYDDSLAEWANRDDTPMEKSSGD